MVFPCDTRGTISPPKNLRISDLEDSASIGQKKRVYMEVGEEARSRPGLQMSLDISRKLPHLRSPQAARLTMSQ